MLFIIKVFNRLIVQQTVDGAAVGGVISLISFTDKFITPLCDIDRKKDVESNRDHSNQRINRRKQHAEDHGHRQNFQQRRHNIEH